MKLRITTGNQLVGITLVAGIPNESILAKVEYSVQSQGKLDHTKIRSEVGTSAAQKSAESLPDLSCQLGKLPVGEAL
jgi:hypothetical protein